MNRRSKLVFLLQFIHYDLVLFKLSVFQRRFLRLHQDNNKPHDAKAKMMSLALPQFAFFALFVFFFLSKVSSSFVSFPSRLSLLFFFVFENSFSRKGGMEESLRTAEDEKPERKVWLQYLFKALIGFAGICFFVGWFLLAFGYTAYGWSTVITWSNTTCSVLSSFAERRTGNDAIGRNVFEVSSGTSVYRRAAVSSMLNALFLETGSASTLLAQAAFYVGRSNVPCFVPQTTIAYSQSRNVSLAHFWSPQFVCVDVWFQMLGALTYYRVNSARNFVVLDYTATSLAEQVSSWRSFVIAGVVLIGNKEEKEIVFCLSIVLLTCSTGVGALLWAAVFVWWCVFLRKKATHKLIAHRDPNERDSDTNKRRSFKPPR